MSENVDSLPEEQPQEVESTEEEQLELDQVEEGHEYNFDDVLEDAVEGIEDDEEPVQPEVAEPEAVEEPVVESAPEPEQPTLNPELEEQRRNMQADYTQKTQELADMRKQTEPFAVLNSQLQNNPELLQQVIGLVAQQNAPPPEAERPEDPIEDIHFTANQNAQKLVNEATAPLLQQMQQMEAQNTINQALATVQKDPLYNDTQKAMSDYVQGEYANIHGAEAAKQLYQRLDSDVNAYQQMYGSFRAKVEGQNKAVTPLGKQKTNAPSISADQGVPVVPKPRATRRKQSDLAKRAMTSGSRGAAVDYFESTGMFDKF